MVYMRPSTLPIRIAGFADKETVAQAAQNAAHGNVNQPAADGARPRRELFVRHARRDGRSIAILRAIDYGDSCVVEAEVYPVRARNAEPSGPARTPSRTCTRRPHS